MKPGPKFEKDVAAYLADTTGYPVERRVQGGVNDKGDLAGIPGWVIECKATKAIDLAGAVDEAALEAANANADSYAAVIKRRNKGVDKAYAVVPLWLLAELIG